MTNQIMTIEKSLEIIDKAVADTKLNYQSASSIFILWGWLMSIACVTQFFLIIFHGSYNVSLATTSIINWLVFCTVGLIAQISIIRKIKLETKVVSHIDGYLKSLWLVCLIAMMACIVLIYILKLPILPFVLLISGMGLCMTGLMIKFQPLVFGALIFFLLSISSVFVANQYLNLIACTAVVFGVLVPGYMLKFLKE